MGTARRLIRRGIESLSDEEAARLARDWSVLARSEQWPPAGDWRIWLFLGGRGAGKTRAGAEWIARLARDPAARLALVAPGHAAAREVMIEGPSGLLAVSDPAARPAWEPGRRRLVWPSGAVAHAFSAEEPDSLRGPQFTAAWADEFAAWPRAQESFDMLRLGLRLGAAPRLLVTTTPRPAPAMTRLMALPDLAVTRAATAANAANLAPGFLEAMEAAYAGSRLARQELHGELVEDPGGAVWTRALIETARRAEPPEALDDVVVGLDPPAGAGEGDACGLVAAGAGGRGRERRAVVLADRTLNARPEIWAAAAAALVRDVDARAVIAEANQGGDMVRAVLHAAEPGLPVRLVRARTAKRARAEPVAALYAQARIAHRAGLERLEDEMCAFGAPGATGSPDRTDALVWAVTALFEPLGDPRLRRI